MNAEYYRDSILNVLIPEMDGLARRKPYLFMQDGARFHTAQSTVEMLRSQRHLELLGPNMWPTNSPDLNPVDFSIWGALEAKVYRGGQCMTNLDELRTAIEEEREAFPQETIDHAINSFKSSLKRVIEKGGHIEKCYDWFII